MSSSRRATTPARRSGRRTSRQAEAALTVEATAQPATDDAPQFKRDELTWKQTRLGEPMSPELALEIWSNLRSRFKDAESDAGKAAHDLGTLFNRLYGGIAEASLGYRRFSTMLEDRFPLGADAAYGRMRFADALTEDEATFYGYSVGLKAIQLLPFYNCSKVSQLEGKELPVNGPDGEPLLFPQSWGVLCKALKEFKARALAAEAGQVDGALARQVRAYAVTIAEHLEKSPELEALKPHIVVADDRAFVSLRSMPVDELDAVIALLKAIRKIG